MFTCGDPPGSLRQTSKTAPPPVPRVEKLMKLLRFLRIWEHLYQQLKRIGSIFHALEALCLGGLLGVDCILNG